MVAGRVCGGGRAAVVRVGSSAGRRPEAASAGMHLRSIR